MAAYLGDIAEDATIYFPWSTTDKSGASITRAVNGTVSVYKDDGVGQSVAGVTDTEDFDALTGIHMCKIDTSADAFYATGHDYSVILSAATIDGETVNAVLGYFSIENRFEKLTTDGIADQVWDEARAGHVVAGTFGEHTLADVIEWRGLVPAILSDTRLRVDLERWLNVGPAALSDTRVRVDLERWLNVGPNALQANRVDVYVGTMAANVLTAAATAAAWFQEAADRILDRPISNVEPGAVLRTLYGAVCALVNRARINPAGNLEVYKTNDADVLGTFVATTDEDQDPISELNP